MIDDIKAVAKNRTFMRFFYRSLLFLSLFLIEILVLTLLIDFQDVDLGNMIAGSNLHLAIYIFILVFLIISPKELLNVRNIGKQDYKKTSLFLILNLVLISVFYKLNMFFIENTSAASQNPVFYSIVWLISGSLAVLSLLLAFFDPGYIIYFIRKFRNQITTSVLLSFLFLFFLRYALKLWPHFSNIVAKSVYLLLNIFFEGAILKIDGTVPIVGIPGVSGKIYASCSGIEGMILFLLLFTVLFLMEYKSVNKKKVLFLYTAGVIGAFIINILRTFAIFVVGYFTSQEFAVGTFHSNAGWILFTLYFLVFVYLTNDWMKK